MRTDRSTDVGRQTEAQMFEDWKEVQRWVERKQSRRAGEARRVGM